MDDFRFSKYEPFINTEGFWKPIYGSVTLNKEERDTNMTKITKDNIDEVVDDLNDYLNEFSDGMRDAVSKLYIMNSILDDDESLMVNITNGESEAIIIKNDAIPLLITKDCEGFGYLKFESSLDYLDYILDKLSRGFNKKRMINVSFDIDDTEENRKWAESISEKAERGHLKVIEGKLYELVEVE